MTFSIVALDPKDGAVGVAVASKFLAVGAVVPWARAGVGAIATQAWVKVSFGPDGLALLSQGKRAQEVVDLLLKDDPKAAERQFGVVDVHGGAAAHSGSNCFDWAGHLIGEGFACQGNILAGAHVVEAMADAFRSTSGLLERRLYAALLAGDRAGGDRRGRQSAAIMVRKPNGGYGGDNDMYLDLRVDDHADPVPQLESLLFMHHLYLGHTDPADLIPIDEALARELKAMMQRQGYYQGEISGNWDAASIQAFWALVGNENLEARWSPEKTPNQLDKVALDYLRQRFA